MTYEEVVKKLKAVSPEQKGEVIGKAVRSIIDKHDSGTANVAKRRWESYAADEELSKLVRAEREAMLGKGY
jgi:hypothetical protein